MARDDSPAGAAPSDLLGTLDARGIARLIRDGELSCLEVTDLHLARIDALNPTLNAFCTVLHDEARAAARAADATRASGRSPGPLHGLPVAIKDLTATAGIRTTRGSRAFADHVPGVDAVIVERLRAAGAILIGKTNTPEFGHQCVTDNLLFGATRNPWRTDRTAGGSSGGSATAVASGMVPLAEGSDGAGSIRVPAAMCGVVGFKPGFGQVPAAAGSFAAHSPFLHNGPIARSVEDAARMFRVMAGASDRDPFSLPIGGQVPAALKAPWRAPRIGWSSDLGHFAVDADMRRVFAAALDGFRALGWEVVEVCPRLPPDLERHFRVLWSVKQALAFEALSEAQQALVETSFRSLVDEAADYRAIDVARANLARDALWDAMLDVHRQCDVLACPVTSMASFSLTEGPPASIEGRAIDPLLGWLLTWPFNLSGHPVLSMPCGRSAEGMPVGMQLVGPRFGDQRLLALAQAFERVRPWPAMSPPPRAA